MIRSFRDLRVKLAVIAGIGLGFDESNPYAGKGLQDDPSLPSIDHKSIICNETGSDHCINCRGLIYQAQGSHFHSSQATIKHYYFNPYEENHA